MVHQVFCIALRNFNSCTTVLALGHAISGFSTAYPIHLVKNIATPHFLCSFTVAFPTQSDHTFKFYGSYCKSAKKEKTEKKQVFSSLNLRMAGVIFFKICMQSLLSCLQLCSKYGLVQTKGHRAMNRPKHVDCFHANNYIYVVYVHTVFLGNTTYGR